MLNLFSSSALIDWILNKLSNDKLSKSAALLKHHLRIYKSFQDCLTKVYADVK